MKNLALAMCAAVALVACGGDYNVRPVQSNDSRHVLEKNYTLGQTQTAYVGQPVVRVKDYDVRSAGQAFAAPIEFTASMKGSPDVHYPAGTKILAGSMMDYEGKTYFMASPTPALPDAVRLLIAQNGSYSGLAVTWDESVFEPCEDTDIVCVKPSKIAFDPTTIDNIVKGTSFINFELIYSGASKDTINLLYREYTPDDLARAAFSQNLTYDRSSSSIRFRDLQIRVIEATNESMRYVVEADGIDQGD